MKNLAMIAFIGLIGLACFVTTDAYSYWDRDAGMSTDPWLTFVYGYVYVEYSYAFPVVSSSHGVYIANDSGIHPDWPGLIPVKCYVNFTSELLGEFNEPFDPDQDWSDEQWVAGSDTWGDGRSFEFDLSNQPWQEITINAASNLTVKVDHNGDGAWDASDGWRASIDERFYHRDEPLGIE